MMLQILVYAVSPVAITGIYASQPKEVRSTIRLMGCLVGVDCLWITTALLVWWGSLIGLYTMDAVLHSLVIPMAILGFGLAVLSGALGFSSLRELSVGAKMVIVGALPILLALYDYIAAAHVLVRVFVLPWIMFGYRQQLDLQMGVVFSMAAVAQVRSPRELPEPSACTDPLSASIAISSA